MPDNAIENIYKFVKLSNFATAGQPTKQQFSVIKDSGYEVVINLALPESTNALPDEKNVVESQGMQYIHIPVIWENPTLDDFKCFLSAMEANAKQNVFVHCAANMRVSVFMYLYHRIHESKSEEEAKQNLEKIWIPNKIWQQFIEEVIQHYQ